MLNFNKLTYQLSEHQLPYSFPYTVRNVAKLTSCATEDLMKNIVHMINKSYPDDFLSQFDIISSAVSVDTSTILTALANIMVPPTSETNHHKIIKDLKNYLRNWIIKVDAERLPNAYKLIDYIDNDVDHEDLLMLISLVFNINIIIVNLDGHCRVHSATNINNMYVLMYQSPDLRYSAVKYRPKDKSAMANYLELMSVIEANNQLIVDSWKHMLSRTD